MGVLGEFTGVLVRDGDPGYEHLPQAIHAWCGAHPLRDPRSISDADPWGQLWALAMAGILAGAHHAARAARAEGADRLTPSVLARIGNHYRGALARGDDDNVSKSGSLVTEARTLIHRFRRFEDMILRFVTDLSSGGAWRTLHGLADFRDRPVLPGPQHQLTKRQTSRTPATLHHRSLVAISAQPG